MPGSNKVTRKRTDVVLENGADPNPSTVTRPVRGLPQFYGNLHGSRAHRAERFPMSKSTRKFETVTPGPNAPVDALVMTDAITLRLGKLSSLIGMVADASANINATRPETELWAGLEVLADLFQKELESISDEVGDLYRAMAGGAR